MYTINDIRNILMNRDGMTRNEANDLIGEAKRALLDYCAEGDIMSAMDICEEYFGLEPDYMSAFGLC